mgnify:CR=1 FL=1
MSVLQCVLTCAQLCSPSLWRALCCAVTFLCSCILAFLCSCMLVHLSPRRPKVVFIACKGGLVGCVYLLEDGRVLGGVVMHDAMQCRCAKSWSCALPAEAFYSLVGKTLVPLTSQTSKSLARVLPKPIKYRTTHVALSTEMRRRHADWLGPYTTKSDNRPITCEI